MRGEHHRDALCESARQRRVRSVVRQLPIPQLSSLICASLITGPHLSVSDFRKEANSASVEPFGTAPSSSKRVFTGGCSSAALVSALSLAMISFGVFFGTKKPNHDTTSKPG